MQIKSRTRSASTLHWRTYSASSTGAQSRPGIIEIEPVDLAVSKVKVGPFERLDCNRGVADRDAVTKPGIAPAPGMD